MDLGLESIRSLTEVRPIRAFLFFRGLLGPLLITDAFFVCRFGSLSKEPSKEAD